MIRKSNLFILRITSVLSCHLYVYSAVPRAAKECTNYNVNIKFEYERFSTIGCQRCDCAGFFGATNILCSMPNVPLKVVNMIVV